MSDTLLVTGAAGHLGQAVLRHLLDTLAVPAQRIVAATRQPGKLAALAARGVSVRAADFDDAAALPAAFAGVQRLLLISTDALDRPGRRLAQHRAAVQAAAQAGVQHVVYTSMPGPQDSPVIFAPDHAGTEQALADSALPGWTVLRNHWYFETLFMSLPSVLAAGRWYSANGDGRQALIARDDLARAAATALAGSATGRHTWTLSGAQAYTTAELAHKVSQVVGKPIQVVPVSVDELARGVLAAGAPQGLAQMLASIATATAQHRLGEVTDDYRRLTGQAPQSLDDWLASQRQALAAL